MHCPQAAGVRLNYTLIGSEAYGFVEYTSCVARVVEYAWCVLFVWSGRCVLWVCWCMVCVEDLVHRVCMPVWCVCVQGGYAH